MSLQKKNNLIRSHIAVLVFWFVVLFFAYKGFDLGLLAKSIAYAIMIMVGGAIIGVTIWVTYDLLRHDSILQRNRSNPAQGAIVSIGNPPVPAKVARAKASESLLASRFKWWNEYRKKYPQYADAFLAVFQVMYVTPNLPASPVPGGHGGATLIEHSFNVVRTMMEMAPNWVYRGHRNKRGEIVFPLLDNTRAEFRFTKDDPIVPLTAFAHDIGKTACYKLEPDGSVREVRKNHDIEGAKILRTLPEIMALPWKDRMAILIACEYYHHIGSLPQSIWIDDRARALVELLIAADIETGKREGGVIVNEYEDGGFVLPQNEDKKSPDTPGENRDVPIGVEQSGALPEVQSGSHRATPAKIEHGTALDLAYSVLLEPGRVNGTNVANRIAWKHGEWLYISDVRLRAAVAKMTGDSSYNTLPHRGNMHPFTLELMSQLSKSGNLLQEHDGKKFSEKRAIFTTRSVVPGKTSKENKFVIVANVRAFPGLERAADCKVAPQIIGCSWGENAAINKSSSFNQEDNHTGDGEAENIVADMEWSADDIEDLDAQLDMEQTDDADPVKTLLTAAHEMKIPFIKRIIDGEEYLLFEEEIVNQEFPGLNLDDERLIKRSGAKSGKNFIGIRGKA